MTKFLTPKQIAQTYIINDIIIHELILSSLSEIEKCAKTNKLAPTTYEIINRICVLASQDSLFNEFELSTTDILRIVKNEYQQEVAQLAEMLSKPVD